MTDPVLPRPGDVLYMTLFDPREVLEVGDVIDGTLTLTVGKDGFRSTVRMPWTDTPPRAPKAPKKESTVEHARLGPQDKADVAAGRKCRPRLHDLTATLPTGKAALYISPKGVKACRWCKLEAAERHSAKTKES